MYDYGFELPDKRWIAMDTEGREIAVVIQRNWYQSEDLDDENNYTISWKITVNNKVTMSLPEGTSESKAIQIAELLYEIDQEATEDIRESDRIQQMEMRYGA